MEPVAVTCGTASSPRSRASRRTMASVRSRVVPPAPQVTETNAGPSAASSSIADQNASSASTLRGGKNSNETDGAAAGREEVVEPHPPATAGRIVTSSPSPTAVSSPSRKRMSSPFR